MNLEDKKSISLDLYQHDIKTDLNTIQGLLNQYNFIDETDKGFHNINIIGDAITGEYIDREEFTVECIIDNREAEQSLMRYQKAQFIIIDNFIMVTGKAKKELLHQVSRLTECKIVDYKLSQDQLSQIENQAYIIKNIKLKDIKHCEIKQLTLFGDLEDIYGIKGLQLNDSSISMFSGSFALFNSTINLKFYDKGTINIHKPKGKIIDVDVVRTVFSLFDK